MDHEGEEKCTLIYFFNELKVPTSYCANPKRLVNMRELKFNYGCMKAHNCHVIMTQLLPVALCGMLPPKVGALIIKLCSFFNVISQKVIHVSTLDQLQRDIAEALTGLRCISRQLTLISQYICSFILLTKLEP
jgi:hypothetical protein